MRKEIRILIKESIMLKKDEENQIYNVRAREKEIEALVLESIDKIESSMKDLVFDEEDMNWRVVNNFSNPTKEEINRQLSRIPAMQAYYNNMKTYAQLLMDIAENELFVAQVNAREEYKQKYQQEVLAFENRMIEMMNNALRSTIQDKAIKVVNDMIKAHKLKEPTEKDYEAYIKGKTANLERQVLIHKYRVTKLREFCKVLENKFLAARALRYSIEETLKADINTAKIS